MLVLFKNRHLLGDKGAGSCGLGGLRGGGAWAGKTLEVLVLPLPAPIVPTYISYSVVVCGVFVYLKIYRSNLSNMLIVILTMSL